jgi:hypothetical protein
LLTATVEEPPLRRHDRAVHVAITGIDNALQRARDLASTKAETKEIEIWRSRWSDIRKSIWHATSKA